jgi:hypothetical protein
VDVRCIDWIGSGNGRVGDCVIDAHMSPGSRYSPGLGACLSLQWTSDIPETMPPRLALVPMFRDEFPSRICPMCPLVTAPKAAKRQPRGQAEVIEEASCPRRSHGCRVPPHSQR